MGHDRNPVGIDRNPDGMTETLDGMTEILTMYDCLVVHCLIKLLLYLISVVRNALGGHCKLAICPVTTASMPHLAHQGSSQFSLKLAEDAFCDSSRPFLKSAASPPQGGLTPWCEQYHTLIYL